MTETEQYKRNSIVRKKMLDVRNVRFGPLPQDSPWMRPVRMYYTQDGQDKIWDLLRSHDSVSLVVFNTSRKKLVFVKQFRPAAYYAALPEQQDHVDTKSYPSSLGVTLELCAGIVDKDKSLVEIAREELLEECGYEAPVSAFTKVITYRYVATATAKQTLFYIEVTDDMHTHPGGGAESEGELIEVIELSIKEVEDYMNSGEVQSPSSFLFGVTWFLANKRDRYSS